MYVLNNRRFNIVHTTSVSRLNETDSAIFLLITLIFINSVALQLGSLCTQIPITPTTAAAAARRQRLVRTTFPNVDRRTGRPISDDLSRCQVKTAGPVVPGRSWRYLAGFRQCRSDNECADVH